VTCTLLLVGCSGSSSTPAQASRDESQFARAAAEDFLIVTGPGLGREHKFTSKKFKWPDGEDYYEFKSWSITSQTMSQSETEATIRGSIQATKQRKKGVIGADRDFKDTVGFRMQLVKEQGKWLVDEIVFGGAPVEAKP